MKVSKIRKHIISSKRVFVPFTVGENTVNIPVVKSAVRDILATFDKSDEFPATLAVGDDGELTLTLFDTALGT